LKRFFLPAAWAVFLVACSPPPSPTPIPASTAHVPSGEKTPTAEVLAAPRIPVSPERKVVQTLVANLDQDASEEQVLVLQNRTNLSLPVTIQVADYDQARKTYYLAWEGTALASASQPVTLNLDDLIGDHQKEVLVQGLDEAGHPCLDVLRLVPTSGNLGLAYRTIFSKVSRGTIRIDHPTRPEAYSTGQNSNLSDTIVIDEPDPGSRVQGRMIRTTYAWLFQKGEYVSTLVERYQREVVADATLEKIYSGDTPTFEGFLNGPWVKVISDKTGLLILFFDPASREITIATPQAQEVYHWDVSSRSSRASLYLIGSNSLIDLIKLQMSVSATASDSLEVSSQDNPAWTGTYKRLDPSAAMVLARQGIKSLPQQIPPVGLYRNEKGDEFDFQAPEVRLKWGGVSMVGSVAVYPLGGVTVLQIKVPGRPGNPGVSRAYSMVAQEESSTSRIVRTLRLQGGFLTSKGWISDQSDPLRLEQVEGTATNALP
jgi:hypothetical protein